MDKEIRALAQDYRKRGGWAVRLCLWATLAGLVVVPVEVQAHAQLARSNPADRSTLTKSPKQLQIWFNELLDDGFNVVEIYPADQLGALQRTNLVEGKAGLDPKDRTCLVVNIKPLPPGNYVAEWRVLSRDGHSAPGRITFRIAPPK